MRGRRSRPGLGWVRGRNLWPGATVLLLREQKRVIQNDYDAMREHDGPVGDLFTCGFREVAGGQRQGHVCAHIGRVPVQVGPERPQRADRDLRGRPARRVSGCRPIALKLLRDPNATRALVSTPVADRAGDFRKLPDRPYPGG